MATRQWQRELGVPAEARSDVRSIQRALADAATCDVCGRTRAVLNTAGYRRPFSSEPVTLASHCSCVGGPAAALVPPLTDDTIINFDGEPSRFGNLFVQDRKTVQWNARSLQYEGGYGF